MFALKSFLLAQMKGFVRGKQSLYNRIFHLMYFCSGTQHNENELFSRDVFIAHLDKFLSFFINLMD